MKTKIFLLLTAWLSLLLSVSAEVVTGTDGENITWSLDRETGVLTINGTGATTNDRPWQKYISEVKEIIVGEGITELGDSAFYCMSRVHTIKLPTTLAVIRYRAFYYCSSQTTVNIPAAVKDLNYAFEDCKSLESVVIPDSMTTMCGAFSYCTSLKTVNIPSGVTNLKYAFEGCTSLEGVVVPESVTSMNCAFRGCQALESVVIPGSVTSLVNAFGGCTALESVVIPESVTNMSEAFVNCTSLKSANIPAAATNLSYAFDGCENLDIDVVLKNVTDIRGTFRNCKRIKSVDMFYTHKTDLLDSAFKGCDSIKDVMVHLRIPRNISDLNMFSDATLQNATLHVPNGCRRAYAEANVWKDFSKIVQDQDATDVISAGGQLGGINWTLSDDGVLKIEATSPEMKNSGIMQYPSSGNYPWQPYSAWITEICVDNNVTVLGWECFAFMTNLRKITIPFFGMWAEYPDGVTSSNSGSSIGAIFECECTKNNIYDTEYTFKFESNLREIVYTGSTINYVTAFETKYQTRKSFSDIYTDTYKIGALDSITFTFNGLTEIKEFKDDYNNRYYFPWALIGIPVNLDFMGESIPAGALVNLTGLRSLKLKGTGAANGSTTFALNSLFDKNQRTGTTLVDGYYIPANLEEVVIKEGTATIPNAAFKNLSMIKKITLPSTVVGVGEEAFYGCSGLTDLYVNSAFPPAAYSNCFTGVSKYNCKLHVPIDSKEYYKGDDYWKYFYFIETDANVTITVKKNIDNAGVVAGITKYNNGEEARLTAVPNGGYSFLMWQNERGETLSTSNELVFRATCDSTIYAIFKPMLNAGDVTATPTENTVTLTWTQQEGATTYTVSIYADATMTDLVKTITFDANGNVLSIQKVGYAAQSDNTMSATIQDLKAEMHYFYSISAFNQEGVLISQQAGDFNTLEDTGIQYLSLPDGNVSLSFGKNMITVSGADASICVYSAFGQLVATHAKADTVTFELPAGTYVVRSGNKTWKVLVK